MAQSSRSLSVAVAVFAVAAVVAVCAAVAGGAVGGSAVFNDDDGSSSSSSTLAIALNFFAAAGASVFLFAAVVALAVAVQRYKDLRVANARLLLTGGGVADDSLRAENTWLRERLQRSVGEVENQQQRTVTGLLPAYEAASAPPEIWLTPVPDRIAVPNRVAPT